MRLTIIGAGRAAWTFGSIWARSGQGGLAIIGRGEIPRSFVERLGAERRALRPESFSDADLVLFAVPDHAIEPVHRELRSAFPEGTPLFHVSGALSSTIFDREPSFSLHPLRSLAPVGTSPIDLTGSVMVWEGHPSTEEYGREITRLAGGDFRAIQTPLKPLYHAAAVFGSNYVAASLEAARHLMDAAGLPDPDPALESLAASAIANWRDGSGRSRFTGPLTRGEVEVIRGHLESLEPFPLHLSAYRALARLLLNDLGSSPRDSDLQEIAAIVAETRQS